MAWAVLEGADAARRRDVTEYRRVCIPALRSSHLPSPMSPEANDDAVAKVSCVVTAQRA